jgi:hypothetical protein
MFDPSKLDLNLDNTEEQDNKKIEPSIEKKEEVIEKNLETQDILGDLSESENKVEETPEDTPILEEEPKMETEEENNIGEDIMSAQSEVADEPV